MQILIAEDDVTSRVMLTMLLRKWSFDPLAVNNGGQAWNLLKHMASACLILLDWHMPEMNGQEVIQRVRAMETEIPHYILLMTSTGDKTTIIAGLNAGADDYIMKPFDPEELRTRLRIGQRILDLQAELRALRALTLPTGK